jgi:DNA-binding NarL/FixJ family response regulator
MLWQRDVPEIALHAEQIVGREPELAALEAFVGGEATGRGLLLTGSPGVGKSTLWEAGVRLAREQRTRVLGARSSSAEAQMSWAGLIDLFDGVTEELACLPRPQLHALQVALRRVEPGDTAPEPGAIALGVLSALRSVAADAAVLVAIDDIQWLDAPSGDVLTFAARRLERDRVRFLLTRRTGSAGGIERALEPGVERFEVGPLSLGSVRRLLLGRLHLALPRQLLRRVLDVTMGNPLFALEVGRTLQEKGLPAIGEPLPVPDDIEALLGTRVARLRAPARKLLLALALQANLDLSQLAAVAGSAAVEDAVDAGLLQVDGDRVRASHPLLPAAARKHSRARARRELHRELATLSGSAEVRVKHLVLGAEKPDARLAAAAADAAVGASARGGRQEAVELAEHALRLTPASAPERSDRLLALADYLVLAGEKQRATALLAPALDEITDGSARARALLILATGVVRSDEDLGRYFERALVESERDPALHATLRLRMAQNAAFLRLTRIAAAQAWAEKSLPTVRRAGRKLEQLGLDAVAWVRILRGFPIDDLCERHRAVSDAASYIAASPERAAAQRLAWRGELVQARAQLTRLQQLADERVEVASYVVLRLHLCELELRAGDLEAVSRLLDEWVESPEPEYSMSTQYHRCRALLAAARGLPTDAEQWAELTIEQAEATGSRWDVLEALRARGLAALLSHDTVRAADSLRTVWEHTCREDIDEPGVFPAAPDLVEALVELEEVDEARAVCDRLRGLAKRQEHPWGRATAKRCDALVALGSRTDEDAAVAGLEAAASEYGELGLRFDEARTPLLLGRAQRRRRQWAAARHALDQAVSTFDAMGSAGWADEARSELARVGARRPRPAGELTPAERRVAELARDGRSNKEIAQTLFVSVKTVEHHLSHIYAKLGVRSRTQLARRLSAPT